MSDYSPTMEQRRKYLNYTTPFGISLSRAAKSGCSAFLLHESGYQPALQDWNHQGVDSPFWRFYHNPKPGCHVRFDGRDIPLESGSALLIPANTIFDCCGPIPACHLWLHFTITQASGILPDAPIVIPVDDVLNLLIRAVLDLHEEQPPGDSRDQRLYHHCAALLHAAFARVEVPVPPAMPERFQEVLTLIHRAPQADLSNPFLAARAGMSVERFIRSFRDHTGLTPAAYVTATRVRLAGEALALTDKTIEQIAVENGFPNRHYFTRMFTRQLGCGPAEFRARQHRRRGR
ncbi:MAG: AraC family transcriptional regulator [Prosthecobacter sp.]|nr:AraC family transcriptional regulator [Prosthecobacter sp.]